MTAGQYISGCRGSIQEWNPLSVTNVTTESTKTKHLQSHMRMNIDHHIVHRMVVTQPTQNSENWPRTGQIHWGMAPICGIYGRVPAPNKNHPEEISNKNHRTQGGCEAEEVKYGSDPSVPPISHLHWPPHHQTLSPACPLCPTVLERCLSTVGWSDIRAHSGDKLERFHLSLEVTLAPHCTGLLYTQGI